MSPDSPTSLSEIIRKHETELLQSWIAEQMRANSSRRDLIRESELRGQSAEFLSSLAEALRHANSFDVNHENWRTVRDLLTSVTRTRTKLGFSPTETATFVFSFKQPLFFKLQQELGQHPTQLMEEIWNANRLLDQLGLYTTEVHQSARESVIIRQQEEMMELSTPVVKLWNGILALPLIGTLDSARTQVVMEALLQRVVETGSSIAIIDITGVPTVDTLTAQHLLKTVAAARLMGADCIISGIRPQIAQTVVHLGVDLSRVTTKSSLADAFVTALHRTGQTIQATDSSKQG